MELKPSYSIKMTESLNNTFKFFPFPLAILNRQGDLLNFNDAWCNICAKCYPKGSKKISPLCHYPFYWKKISPIQSENLFVSQSLKLLDLMDLLQSQEFSDKINIGETVFGPTISIMPPSICPLTCALNDKSQKIDDNDSHRREAIQFAPIFTPLWNNNLNQFSEILLTLKDISEENLARQEMLYKQKEIEAILDHSPSVIFMKDMNGRFSLVNKAFEKLFNMQRNEILGKSDDELCSGEVANQFKKNDEVVKKHLQPIYAEEILPDRLDPSKKKNFLTSKFPILDHLGHIRGVGGVATDISPILQVQLEKVELETKARLANEASQMKSDFLANISHEIRTPLNGIIGMTQLAIEQTEDHEHLRYLHAIEQSSRTLLALINDILDFSKLEAGHLKIKSVSFKIDELVNDLEFLYRPLVEKKNLVFKISKILKTPHYSIYDLENLKLWGDPIRIQQIVSNLFANSIKFTSKGSIHLKIMIEDLSSPQLHDAQSTTQPRVQIQFAVEDTGIGISPKNMERIFQRFTQLDSSMDRQYSGSGLGLSICRELAELMGGKVHAKSIEHQGSEFFLSLELPKLSTEEIKKSSSTKLNNENLNYAHSYPLLHEERSKIHILVAEDNPINQEITVRMLAKAGFITQAVCSGEEVLQKIKDRQNFDLILMDCQMPVLDGYEATRQLRQLGYHKPIIALTANAFQEDEARCFEAGMSGYLSKPVPYDHLIKAIDYWALIKE